MSQNSIRNFVKSNMTTRNSKATNHLSISETLRRFRLTEEEEAENCNRAQYELLPSLIQNCNVNSQQHDWRLKRKAENMTAWDRFDGHNKPLATSRSHVMSSTSVEASLDSVLEILCASSKMAFQSYMRNLYDKRIAHCDVPFYRKYPSLIQYPSQASFASRWLICRSDDPLGINIDMCLFDYMSKTSDFSGKSRNQEKSALHNDRDQIIQPDAYQILWTVSSQRFPDFYKTHNILRANIPLAGFLLYRTEKSETTDVVFYASCTSASDNSNPEAKLQDTAVQKLLSEMTWSLERFPRVVNARKWSMLLCKSLADTLWEKGQCATCFEELHLLRRRPYRCQLCTKFTCGECAVQGSVDLPSFGKCNIAICTLCHETRCGSGTHALPIVLTKDSTPQPKSNVVKQSRFRSKTGVEGRLDPKYIAESSKVKKKGGFLKLGVKAQADTQHVMSPTESHNQCLASRTSKNTKLLDCQPSKRSNAASVKSKPPIIIGSAAKSTLQSERNQKVHNSAATNRTDHQKTTEVMTRIGSTNAVKGAKDSLKMQLLEKCIEECCQKLILATDCKYGAVSVRQNNHTEEDTNFMDLHYLMVKGHEKLLRISGKLGCCALVLQLAQDVLCYDYEACHDPYLKNLLAGLAIVKGPQKARYYVGIHSILELAEPATICAVAVFDPKPRAAKQTFTDREALCKLAGNLTRKMSTIPNETMQDESFPNNGSICTSPMRKQMNSVQKSIDTNLRSPLSNQEFRLSADRFRNTVTSS